MRMITKNKLPDRTEQTEIGRPKSYGAGIKKIPGNLIKRKK